MKHRRTLTALLALAASAGCADEGPQSGPGLLTATLVSPHGAEGAAVVTFFGPGIGEVTATTGELHVERAADTVRVVVLDLDGGELGFSVEVADTTQKPRAVVLEVAGPDDELRADASAYRLEFRR